MYFLLFFKCTVALYKLPCTLKNTLLTFFPCCQHDASSFGRIEPLPLSKNLGLLSQRQVLIMLFVLLVSHDNWPSEWFCVTLRTWLHCGYQMIRLIPCHDSQSWHPTENKSAPEVHLDLFRFNLPYVILFFRSACVCWSTAETFTVNCWFYISNRRAIVPTTLKQPH